MLLESYEFFCQEGETLSSPVHSWFCVYVCVLSHVQLFVIKRKQEIDAELNKLKDQTFEIYSTIVKELGGNDDRTETWNNKGSFGDWQERTAFH